MRRVVASIAAVAALVGACGGGETATTLAPELPVIVEASTEAMTAVDTVHFTIERGGTPVYIFSNVEFLDAEGDYLAPDRAAAIAHVAAEGFTLEMGAIAIEGETWLTNVITGKWEPATEDLQIDAAVLFDPDEGIPKLLREELDAPELVGLDQRSEDEAYHIRGLAPAERIEVLTFGLVRNQDVDVDMWIDPVTGHVVEAAFTTLYRGEDATWVLTFTDYGAEVTIPIPDEING